MSDSSYQQPLPEHRWSQAARGHRIGGAPVAGGWHVYPEMAAAGLWTTPSDLARFAAAVQQARAGTPGAILPPELAGEMLRPHASNARMGLGLRLEGEGSSPRFGHGGDDEGFVAQMLASAEPGPGVVVMVNSDHGEVLLRPLVEAVARAEEWQDVLPQAPQPGQADAGDDLDRCRGDYRLADGRLLRIEREADHLLLISPGQNAIPLLSAGGHEWSARLVNATVAFAYHRDATPARLSLHQEAMYVQDVEAIRVS
jgi:CubicO group peptidase (beta-lactamase class C family)